MIRAETFIKNYVALFIGNRITQAASSLAYYLTMTFFPLLIVAYSVLGSSHDSFVQLLQMGEGLVAEDVMAAAQEFLAYVANDASGLMLPLGLMLLLSYASAALRCVHTTIGQIQGGTEHRGICSFVFSLFYSLVMLAILYFSLVLLLTGGTALKLLESMLPDMGFMPDFVYLRYLLLAVIMFFLMLWIYYVPKRPTDHYPVVPGAALGSLGVFVISPVFSWVMGSSVKYSIVYGSITSFILLMLWLYVCCLVLYSGAVFNLALYRTKKP